MINKGNEWDKINDKERKNILQQLNWNDLNDRNPYDIFFLKWKELDDNFSDIKIQIKEILNKKI